jgi:hypothetical protein
MRSGRIQPVSTGQIYWGAVPFVFIHCIMVGLVIAFPPLVMHSRTPGRTSIRARSTSSCAACRNSTCCRRRNSSRRGCGWETETVIAAPRVPLAAARGGHAAECPHADVRGRRSLC